MHEIEIREFNENDEAELIALFFEFGTYIKDLDKNYLDLLVVGDDYGQIFYKKMFNDVENKNGKLYIVENTEKIVGFIAGVILEVGNQDDEIDCKPHRMGRIIDLYLSEKYRGQGYGSKLIEKMESYFKEKNCYKVNIEVFGPNVEAYKFYKKHGFNERNIDLVKVL